MHGAVLSASSLVTVPLGDQKGNSVRVISRSTPWLSPQIFRQCPLGSRVLGRRRKVATRKPGDLPSTVVVRGRCRSGCTGGERRTKHPCRMRGSSPASTSKRRSMSARSTAMCSAAPWSPCGSCRRSPTPPKRSMAALTSDTVVRRASAISRTPWPAMRWRMMRARPDTAC